MRKCTSNKTYHWFIESLEPRCLLSAGQLDPVFGNGGVVRINGAETLEIQTQASAQEGDGKILLGGISMYNGGVGNFIDIARLTTAGQLDASFGTDGQVELGAGFNEYDLKSLQITIAGNILVGADIAAQNGTTGAFQITRLLPDGSVDTSFGSAGSVTIPLHSGSVNAMAVDSTGDIYLAGTDGVGQGSFTVTRLSSDGSLDVSFAKHGHAIVSFSSVGHGPKRPIAATANAITIAPDGSIIIAGGGDGVVFAGEAIRLTSTGGLDTSFAAGGRLVVPAAHDGFSALAFAWRGSILFAGTNGNPTPADQCDLAATLVDHSGALVPSFGIDGTTFTYVESEKQRPTQATIAAIAVLPNRQILISGAAAGHFVNGILLTRINPNGVPDSMFGQGGLVVESIAAATSSNEPNSGQYNVLNAAGLFIQSNGDAIVPYAASASTTPTATAELRAVAFNMTGSLDANFGNNAIASIATTAEAGNSFTALTAESNGDVLAIGFNADQSFINEYDTSGNAIGLFNSEAGSIAHAPDGDLLVGHGNAVTCYHADGTIDSTFGVDGTVSFPFSESSNVPASITFLPNGSALVEANYAFDFSGRQELDVLNDLGVTTASISVSIGFGAAGTTGTSISGYNITSAGQILVQYTDFNGVVGAYYDGTMRLVQYNEDLTTDTSFNTINTVSGPYIANAYASVAIAPNGDIYVGNIISGEFQNQIARYTPSGVLDTNFGGTGILPINAAGQLFIQPDGKLLFASGYYGTIYLSRYNADGTVDTAFGTNGSSTIALYPTPSNLASEAPQVLFTLTTVNSQPKLIAAGSFTLPSQPSDAATGSGSQGFIAEIDL